MMYPFTSRYEDTVCLEVKGCQETVLTALFVMSDSLARKRIYFLRRESGGIGMRSCFRLRMLRRSDAAQSFVICPSEGLEDAIGIAGEHSVLFQSNTDAALKLAHWSILLLRLSFKDDGKDKLRAFHGIHTENLRIGEEETLELRIISYVGGDCVQDLHDLTGISGKIHADRNGGNGEIGALVGHGGDQ